MNHHQTGWVFFVIGTVLGLASLACSLGLGGPTPPASPIAVSTEAAGELEGALATAAQSAESGEVSITMTEAQLTSYVNVQLQENPDSIFKDVQVFLRDGQIQLFGTATMAGLETPAQVILDVTTTAEGQLDINIAEADFGPVPVPQSALDTMSDGLDELITGQLGPQATGFRITNVTIADGEMILTGTSTR